MREVIAVCRSRKKARNHVAQVLDRYLWRIGDRTWRGKASNACLDRMARELRAKASRATAVSIQEIRSSTESRMPLIRIGSRAMFSEDGLAPVTSHPSAFARIHGTPKERNGLAVVRIAALFHDLGKAMILFQEMIRGALQGATPESAFIRHELFSATVWDRLFGALDDRALQKSLAEVSPSDIDKACVSAVDWLLHEGSPANQPLKFDFLNDERHLTFAIGMLILTHHRLPEGMEDHIGLLGGAHAQQMPEGGRKQLGIWPGTAFWHEAWWLRRLMKDAAMILPGSGFEGLDIALRGALVFADHVGSSEKELSSSVPEFLANTIKDSAGAPKPADNLSTHVKRVYRACRPSFDMLHRLRERFPALAEAQMPLDLVRPEIEDPRFVWQMEAACAARALAAAQEGGFFACLLAGTGTGKTRGAPTILAGAAFGDHRPERRYFRMTLGLGLRVLATQSAREYIDELSLPPEDIRVLIGKPIIEFDDALQGVGENSTGSESLTALPEWLLVERAEGAVPSVDDIKEAAWLRGLSLDTDRGVPAILDKLIQVPSKKAAMFWALAAAPVIVGTVDHLMGVASPQKSAFLPAAIRTLTADLILDEIDQYSPEDLAAITRLVFQAAAGGRRVIIMSATLTRDVGEALHTAYRAGWQRHAAAFDIAKHVNLLLTGDAPGSVMTNAGGEDFETLYTACRSRIMEALETAPTLRRGKILEPCASWDDLVQQVHEGCREMHDLNASEIAGFRVSVGLVRMTRISHTAALFHQLPAGAFDGRLRLKLCLHSHFPRLHRSWVENRLKQALTRKGCDPLAGLRNLCHTEQIFQRAEATGVRDIEIVCVTSPVIETGNDLDFDYAILDPISMRSIIQAAGRVRRHRPGAWPSINVLILGRSPIAMQSGKLAMPGVESDVAGDTKVSRINLSGYPERHFRDLAGNLSFEKLNAASILSEEGICPLRDAETKLRLDMMALLGECPTLGRYIERTVCRMNRMFIRRRMFRRSTTGNLRYVLSGDGLEYANWIVDISFGRGLPCWRSLPTEFHEIPRTDIPRDKYLFTDILQRAWFDYSQDSGPMPEAMMRTLVTVDIPDFRHDHDNDILPVLTYGEQTGFTNKLPEDLCRPFGIDKKNQ
jgi:CRISPR-associated endonuclease/helicase Cas3